jgi:hypothetical protein
LDLAFDFPGFVLVTFEPTAVSLDDPPHLDVGFIGAGEHSLALHKRRDDR